MEDLEITLPCGFVTKFKEINLMMDMDKFPCPVCKTHFVKTDQCMNMTRNKLVMNKAKMLMDQKSLFESIKNLKVFEDDPKFYIDESFDEIKNQIDLRREEIKLMFNEKVDIYYDDLLKTIDKQKELKLNKFNDKMEKIKSFENDTNNLIIYDDIEIDTKLKLIDYYSKIIKYVTNLAETTVVDLTEASLQFKPLDVDLDIQNVFGKINWQEETKIISVNDQKKTDQEETTFQLVINNFSNFLHARNMVILSKPCIVNNFEWKIQANLVEHENDDTTLGFFLRCDPLISSNVWSVNANVELSI
ncbi:ubiquitin carboxyl-terminal hydrolase 7-like, partial [Brachionus plicatilis]